VTDHGDDGTRRDLEELITLHELESEMPEVIVEGRTDAGVFQTFLDEHSIEAAVFAIVDRVNLPRDVVVDLEKGIGNRVQVVSAASAAYGRNVGASLTFIVDSDFGSMQKDGAESNLAHLLLTDYGSLECYSLTENVFRRLLRVPLRAKSDLNIGEVLDSILDALVDIFLCRWILNSLDNPPSIVEKLDRRCSFKSGKVEVDVARLVGDSMAGEKRSRKGVPVDRDELASEVVEAKRQLKGDRRRFIRGHDIAKMLLFALLKRAPQLFREDRRLFKSPVALEFALLCCLDFHELGDEELFRALVSRLGGIVET
jgi:hypothetical protein